MPTRPEPKIKPKSFKHKPVHSDGLYCSSAWRKLRLSVIQSQPLCNHCKRAPSTVADHVTPVRLGGGFWDANNLQGLCASCHNRKSGAEARLTP